MKLSLIEQKNEYEARKRKRKFWRSIVTALSCVVVFCTTYALILPAITLENTAYCGHEEHTHSEECYQVLLTCEETDKEIEVTHEHEDACYKSEQNLICSLEETVGHTHGEACQRIEKALICELEETASVLETEETNESEETTETEEIESVQAHQHTEECYAETVISVCELEEMLGHQHSNICYETKETIDCDQKTETIIEEHIHTESCYESVFMCEKPEHMHKKQCYSNPNADVETAEVWEATLPETLTGDYRSDLITVAESQLGYEESKKNYIVAEDGDIKGYSRYGAWYGSTYGDWCAMYISFCLNYAGVDETVMPREAGCQNWIELLSGEEYQLYRLAEEYEPISGDLIFFNNDTEEDSDHVGIVTELIAATEEEDAKIQVIEGNTSDEVAYKTYYLSDSTIMGYGIIPDRPEEFLEGVSEETAAPVKFALKKSADTYAPEGVTLTGVWSEDVIAIANSQIGYAEISSLSKYDQWAGNDGTNQWNVNFVNYCLNYAGVDQNTIPWDSSYDFSQWISVLENAGLYRNYDANQMQAGDIVFVQGWNAGQNYNVGVCVEASGGAFYIVFGDMDGNTRVVKETFWSSWTGRLLGYVRLSEHLTTSIDGVLNASVGYNGGAVAPGSQLVVELTNENATYLDLVESHLKPAGSQIREDYYLDIYFTKDGVKTEPNEDLTVNIEFTTPLNSNKSTDSYSGELEWIYGVISDGMINGSSSEIYTEQDEDQNITKAMMDYRSGATYVLAAMQGSNTTLTSELLLGTTKVTATAIGNSTVLSENMKLEVVFVDEGTDAWVNKLQTTYQTDKELVSTNLFFEIQILDENGVKVDLPEGSKISINLQFDPALHSTLSDGSTARSGRWKMHTIETIGSSVNLHIVDAQTEVATGVSLKNAAFSYNQDRIHALSAIVVDPSYTVIVDTYEKLKTAIESTEDVSQIKLGANITIPDNGGFIITSGRKVFFDLGGFDITTNSTIFTVTDGAELTISDSADADVTTETVAQLNLRADEDNDSTAQLAANKANVGMLAEYNEETEILTYYITETEITDTAVGATKETLVKHTVQLEGTIKGGSEPIIKVEGGNFSLESGALTNCINGAISQSSGTLTLTGGYICNNHKTSGDGGAIYSTGDSEVFIDGTVIAANSSTEDGGAVYISGKEFRLNSGVISGNHAGISGGGVFATGSAKVVINDGYLTNNRAYSDEYRGGGGAIFTNEQANIQLSGGYVTGNYAESGGGGIRTFAARFRMTGGFINSNYANLSEGGGLSTNEYGMGEIIGGYINNNVSNTHQHWGGGGIFSANDSTLYIRNILVTNNDAGGYGGGVAGCSTGRAFVYEEDGGAIYHNTAVDRESSNPHVSGGESTKAEDHIYPTSTFRQYGYEDYFCAFNSIISGTMLGGGSAEWSGTVDGIPVVVAKDEEVSSTYLMGLISNPSDSDIKTAQEHARVYVNGNDSYTHGGGVLGNGYLVIGGTDSVEVYSRLKINASKELTGAELQDKQFRFIIEDMHTNFRIASGTNNAEGDITFDHLIPFTEEGTYEYLIYEDHDSENGEYAGILMDTTQYRLTVNVGKVIEWLEGAVKKDRYVITSIIVDKKNEGDWENIQTITNPDNPDSKPVTMDLGKGSTFHNVVTEYTKFSAVKRWVGNIAENEVIVRLLRDGVSIDEVKLNAANHWTHTWENELPLYHIDWATGEKVFYTYSVEEQNVSDAYEVSYDWFNITESDAIWIPYTEQTLALEKDYIIVAPDGEHVLFLSSLKNDHMITETDKASVVKQTEPIRIDGQVYNDYYYDGTIFQESIYRAQNSNGNIRLNHPAAGYRSIAVPQSGSGYDLQSSWWPLRNLYVGNTKVCTSDMGDSNDYMIVYENGKFDAVPYDPYNANAAKLYTLTYTDLSSETIFTVTNTKIDEDVLYKLDMKKVSADNHDVLLAGAEFALYPMDEDEEANLEHPAIFTRTAAGAYRYLRFQHVDTLTSTDVTTAVTARGGKLVISDLPKGNYVLIETKAPNGYQVADPIKIHLGEGDSQSTTYQMTIEDELKEQPGYKLPETGGTGRVNIRLTGILLVGIAILLHIYKKKLYFRGKHS